MFAYFLWFILIAFASAKVELPVTQLSGQQDQKTLYSLYAYQWIYIIWFFVSMVSILAIFVMTLLTTIWTYDLWQLALQADKIRITSPR